MIDLLTLPAPVILAGAFGTFVLFLFLGLLALPVTAALDKVMGKEKALLLYVAVLLAATFVMGGAEKPKGGSGKAGKADNVPAERLVYAGDPFARPEFGLDEAEPGDGRRRNVFERYSDTRPLPPPTLESPPWLALAIALPPPVPGPAPGYRHVLRGEKPSIGAEAAGIAEIPDAVFGAYVPKPEDVYDSVLRAGQVNYVYILAIDDGSGWAKEGTPEYEQLKWRLASDPPDTTLNVRFATIGGAKAAAGKLDPRAVLRARRLNNAERRPNADDKITLRKTVANEFHLALNRHGINPRSYTDPTKVDVSRYVAAATDMGKVGASGKEGRDGWRRAAELLELALGQSRRTGSDTQQADVLLKLQEAYRALHDEKAVFRVLAQYARTSPREAEAWASIGDLILDRMGEPEFAVAYHERAVTHDRRSGAAWIGMGRALTHAGEYDRALDAFRKAGVDPDAQLAKATGMLRVGELKQAKQNIEQVLVRDPDNVAAMLVRGAVLYCLGELSSARSAFEQCATHQDGHELRAQACYNLGLTCVRLGQKDAALAAFEKCQRALHRGSSAGPSPDETVSPAFGQAFLAWVENDTEGLARNLETARAEAPRSSYVEMFAGMTASLAQNNASAKRALDRALRLAPRYGELDGWFGKVYLGLGRAAVATGATAKESADDFERAIAFMERAANRDKRRDADAFEMRLREALVRSGAEHLPRRQRYDLARETVRQVLANNKHREQPAALSISGYCNFQLGAFDDDQYAQAMREFQQVLDKVPAGDETWGTWRDYAEARRNEIKRWRSLEEKKVLFEGVTLTKDWRSEESNGVKLLIVELERPKGAVELLPERALHFRGESSKDGRVDTPVVFAANGETLFNKKTFEEVSLLLRITGEERGGANQQQHVRRPGEARRGLSRWPRAQPVQRHRHLRRQGTPRGAGRQREAGAFQGRRGPPAPRRRRRGARLALLRLGQRADRARRRRRGRDGDLPERPRSLPGPHRRLQAHTRQARAVGRRLQHRGRALQRLRQGHPHHPDEGVNAVDIHQHRLSRVDRQRGFSFIEILIVMGIIAVLVGGVTVTIMVVNKKQPEFLTRNNIAILSTQIKQWETKFAMLPPGSVKELPKVTGYDVKIKGALNKTNEGAEALYLALRWPGWKAGHTWGANDIGNSDDDKLDAPVATDGMADLRETLDAWGNPIIYFHHLDYGKYAESGQMYVTGPETEAEAGPNEEFEAMPWRNEDGQVHQCEHLPGLQHGPGWGAQHPGRHRKLGCGVSHEPTHRRPPTKPPPSRMPLEGARLLVPRDARRDGHDGGALRALDRLSHGCWRRDDALPGPLDAGRDRAPVSERQHRWRSQVRLHPPEGRDPQRRRGPAGRGLRGATGAHVPVRAARRRQQQHPREEPRREARAGPGQAWERRPVQGRGVPRVRQAVALRDDRGLRARCLREARGRRPQPDDPPGLLGQPGHLPRVARPAR